jgi:hypothetical protein
LTDCVAVDDVPAKTANASVTHKMVVAIARVLRCCINLSPEAIRVATDYHAPLGQTAVGSPIVYHGILKEGTRVLLLCLSNSASPLARADRNVDIPSYVP